MNRSNYLFSEYDLGQVIREQESQMFEEIDSIDRNRLLNAPVEDLVNYFEQKYKFDPPRLLEDKISTDQGEAKVDISQDFNRGIFDRSRPFYITGTGVTFYIPFEGDPDLFKCQSSSLSFNPPKATVYHQELQITYIMTNHDAAAIKSQFISTLAQIKQLLAGTINDTGIFNNGLKQKAESRIKSRKEKLLKDQGLVEALGFPLRTRQNAPSTFVVPMVPKKIIPQIPPTSATPFKPEPTLSMEAYEHILSITSNMVLVMERSPKSFVNMKEEDIRQHFLVQLNGQYQGQATGETFNESGKTDILIREKEKNIFIAECKFWEGQESLTKAINQLLGYTSWRDTKTAIFLFNRNKNFSQVLEKIPDIVKQHPNFKRQLTYSSETGFRFILHHNDDLNREIIVTILAFEIPTS